MTDIARLADRLEGEAVDPHGGEPYAAGWSAGIRKAADLLRVWSKPGSAPGGAGASRTPPGTPDPDLLDAVADALVEPAWPDGERLVHLAPHLRRRVAESVARATGEWLAGRLEADAERHRADTEGWVRQGAYTEADRAAARARTLTLAAERVRSLCGVPAPGATADEPRPRERCPVHDMPDCSPLLNGCSRLTAPGGGQ